MKKFFKESKKTLLALSVIYAVSFWAILRANFYYLDDLGRASGGYKGWAHFSRYISVWLSTLLHGGNYLSDSAPLPQILAILLMALSGALLIYILSDGHRFSPWALVGAVPLALTPYFLECMSYRYDAPYMAISVLFSILPLMFYRDGKKGIIIYIISTLAGMLVMCMSYQASSGIFPMLVVALTFKMWNRGDDAKAILRFVLASVAGYVIALLVYKLFILTPVYSYVTTYQAPVSSLIPTTANNLKTYFSVIIRDFKPGWLILTALLIVAFVSVCVRDSKRNKVVALLLSVLTVAVLLPLSFGMYAVLELSYFNPRAMYGFGVMLAILAVVVTSAPKAVPQKLICFALSWVFIVFAFIYGNCLNVQAHYTDFRIQLIISDLNSLDEFNNDNTKMIKFRGNIGLSPVIEGIPRDNYTMLDNLIPKPLGEEDILSSTGFYYFYDIPNIVRYDYSTELPDDLPILKDTAYHTIRGDGGAFVIELK